MISAGAIDPCALSGSIRENEAVCIDSIAREARTGHSDPMVASRTQQNWTSAGQVEPVMASRRAPATRSVAIALGFLAGLLVVLTLDGPGLTVDEPLDVRPGRTYIDAVRNEGWRFFEPAVVERVFRDNAEHPPLGRWLLGIASNVGQPVEVLIKGPDPTGIYVLSGRLAPALGFGALVALVAATAGGQWGTAAGVSAGFSLLTMPRVFAHAHFAALDTFLSLFWTAAVLAGDRALRSRRPVRAMMAAGSVWSLAILTKIHAWFLMPLLGIWSLVRLSPRRALPAMVGWTLVGIGLYWAGWPWLWSDSWSRLSAYFGTGLARQAIFVQYFGQVFADRDVPWHYPWVYFGITVPVGCQVFGVIGVVCGWKRRKSDPLPVLLLVTIVFFLLLFSTRVPVYDGERLFLHVFPAWALLIGRGFGWVWEHRGPARRLRIVLGVLLLAQGSGVVLMHPFGLSYYNLLVGGLPGAKQLGLEVTYWGDAVDRVLLDRLAREARPGSSAAMAPTLAPFQGALTTGFDRTLARRDVDIVLQDDEAATRAEWVVLWHRTAYWRPELVDRLSRGGGQVVATRSRLGVELSALWHFARGPAALARSASTRATLPPHRP
jgi:4-amino-4-deoxy-L-arabinose transferase-like glycosyltransferase